MKKILINITDKQNTDLEFLAEKNHTSKSALIRYAITKIVRRIKFDNRKYNPLEHMTEEDYKELVQIARTTWINED